MRWTKEILRQKLLLHRSHREVAQSLGVGIGTITSTLARVEQTGLGGWTEVGQFSEHALEERLYPAGQTTSRERRVPDWLSLLKIPSGRPESKESGEPRLCPELRPACAISETSSGYTRSTSTRVSRSIWSQCPYDQCSCP